jgi:hypothetical protein
MLLKVLGTELGLRQRVAAVCNCRAGRRAERPGAFHDPAPNPTYETPQGGASRSFGHVFHDQHLRIVRVVAEPSSTGRRARRRDLVPSR